MQTSSPRRPVIGNGGSMGQISLWDVQSGSKLRDLTKSPMAPSTLRFRQTRSDADDAEHGDIAAMMTNVSEQCRRERWASSVTSLAFSAMAACSQPAESSRKANIDIAAMMSGAMNQRPKKGSKTARPGRHDEGFQS
jgi:hypothetical protein